MNLPEQQRRSESMRSRVTHIATQGKTDIQSNRGHEKIPDNKIQFTPPTSTTKDSSGVLCKKLDLPSAGCLTVGDDKDKPLIDNHDVVQSDHGCLKIKT